jgi:cyclopropane fatty-acyl-phospholipid synthase-like methyltransferase
MSEEIHPWERIFLEKKWPYAEPIPIIGEVIKVFQNYGCRQILDLGCGNGRNAIRFGMADFTIVGADISFTGLKMMQARFVSEKKNANPVLCDFRFPL